MNKLILVAVCLSSGVVVGTSGLTSLSSSPVAAAIPAPPVKPIVPPTLPPGVVLKDKLVIITCPASAPAMFATLGAWQQFAWAGTIATVGYSELRNEAYCTYMINNNPSQIVTLLTQKIPTNAASCGADQATKTVVCRLLLK